MVYRGSLTGPVFGLRREIDRLVRGHVWRRLESQWLGASRRHSRGQQGDRARDRASGHQAERRRGHGGKRRAHDSRREAKHVDGRIGGRAITSSSGATAASRARSNCRRASMSAHRGGLLRRSAERSHSESRACAAAENRDSEQRQSAGGSGHTIDVRHISQRTNKTTPNEKPAESRQREQRRQATNNRSGE